MTWLDLSSDVAELFADIRIDARDLAWGAIAPLRIEVPSASWKAANRERHNAYQRAWRNTRRLAMTPEQKAEKRRYDRERQRALYARKKAA